MAHLEKFTASACGRMLKHFDRDRDESGKYVKFGNMEIDLERTHLNYNLAKHSEKSICILRKRLSEVKVLKRPDVNVMCSWVLTAPKDLNPEKLSTFFRSAYRFMESRYGAANVISANVHLDETTPHMHFAFIPVVTDTKKGIEKVSAKECINRQELRTFHPELQKHLERDLGVKVSVLTGITKEQGGNKSIRDLKKETVLKSLKDGHQIAKEIERHFSDRLKHIQEQPDFQLIQYIEYERSNWNIGQDAILECISKHIPFKEKKDKVIMEKQALMDVFRAAANTYQMQSFTEELKGLIQTFRQFYEDEKNDAESFKGDYTAQYTKQLEDIISLREDTISKANKAIAMLDKQSGLNEAYAELEKENVLLKEEKWLLAEKVSCLEQQLQLLANLQANYQQMKRKEEKLCKQEQEQELFKLAFEKTCIEFKRQTGQDLMEFHKQVNSNAFSVDKHRKQGGTHYENNLYPTR